MKEIPHRRGSIRCGDLRRRGSSRAISRGPRGGLSLSNGSDLGSSEGGLRLLLLRGKIVVGLLIVVSGGGGNQGQKSVDRCCLCLESRTVGDQGDEDRSQQCETRAFLSHGSFAE